MKYDFDTKIDRTNHDAVAVDWPAQGMFFEEGRSLREGFDIIPMWVADMYIPTAPAVREAIEKRLEHPMFGYFVPGEEYYSRIINWQKNRNGVTDLKKEYIGYENGVVGGMVSAMKVFCSPGDKVLVHAPTYIGFTDSLKNNGYDMILSPLVQEEDGIWRMDYADMEEKIKKYKIHAAIFCSPHNPTGRVWEKWEIEKAMEIYRKYDVYVVSDEIWSDLVLDNHRHIPTQSVSGDAKNRTVALYSPSKTFNLAGLIASYHIIYNRWIRERIEKQESMCCYNEMNVLSMHALMGAYSEAGMEWLEELKTVLSSNLEYASTYIQKHFEGIRVTKPQGTYVLFADCKEWCCKNNVSLDELLQRGMEVGVFWQDGRSFFGSYSIRMCLAMPPAMLRESLARLDEYVFNKI